MEKDEASSANASVLLELQKKLTNLSSELSQVNIQIIDRQAQRTKELDDKMAAWRKIEDKIQAETAKAKNRIKLDVGGKQFSMSKDVLLSQKDSYFTAMLGSGAWKPDEDGTYFIDRNPKYFKMILEYMRRGKISCGPRTKEQREALAEELDYFQITLTPMLSQQTGIKQIGSSGIKLTSDTGSKLIEEYEEQIETWLKESSLEKLGTMIYRASRDGFQGTDFHRTCDNKGPTVVLIRTEEDYVFGGYAASSWSSTLTHVNSPTNFLFTLKNPHNIPPTMFKIRPETAHSAQRNHPSYGALFAYDICVAPGPNNHESSFPHSYTDTTGKGNTLFAGKRTWKAKEIEVIQVVDQ